MKKSDFIKQTKTYRLKNYQKLKEISMYENLTMSDMIDFLIENYEMGLKPHKKLNKLQSKRNELNKELNDLDNQISETNKQLSQMEEWRQEKSKEKERAVHTIRRLLVDKRIEEAQISAKHWATITGIPAAQLLLEANKSNKINYNLIEIRE
jgi:chromosome segregation ATPase